MTALAVVPNTAVWLPRHADSVPSVFSRMPHCSVVFAASYSEKIVSADPGSDPRVVDFKSINFDFPILEYRPYRAFDTKQSSAVLFLLFAGAEVPQSSTVTWPPGAPGVKLETIYSIGLRMIFDWRRYF